MGSETSAIFEEMLNEAVNKIVVLRHELGLAPLYGNDLIRHILQSEITHLEIIRDKLSLTNA